MDMQSQIAGTFALPDPYVTALAIVAISAAVAVVAVLEKKRREDGSFDELTGNRTDSWLDPDDEPDDGSDDEENAAYATQQSAYWTCSECDAIFETDETPRICPCCNLPLITGIDGADGEDYVYICDEHGPYVVIQEAGNCCPVCGKPARIAAVAEPRHARWECSECEAEFSVPGGLIPAVCPACRTKFTPDGIRQERKQIHLCPGCGRTFRTTEDIPNHCPHCGERLHGTKSHGETT